MAAVTVNEEKFRIDEFIEWPVTSIANADINAGQIVRLDSTTGKWVLAGAASAGALGDPFIAARTVKAGQALSATRRCVAFLNNTALDALNFGASLYVSDTVGGLDTAAGTVSKKVGIIIPVWGNGATPSKGLLIDLS